MYVSHKKNMDGINGRKWEPVFVKCIKLSILNDRLIAHPEFGSVERWQLLQRKEANMLLLLFCVTLCYLLACLWGKGER